LGPRQALTGPAARGDWSTLARHIDAIPAEERAGYRAGVGLALQLAVDTPATFPAAAVLADAVPGGAAADLVASLAGRAADDEVADDEVAADDVPGPDASGAGRRGLTGGCRQWTSSTPSPGSPRPWRRPGRGGPPWGWCPPWVPCTPATGRCSSGRRPSATMWG